MQTVPLDSPAVKWVNVTGLRRTDDGVVPLRFPLSSLDAFGAMARIARMQAGVEFQLQGEGIRELRVHARLLFHDGYGLFAELFQGPHKLLPTWSFDPDSSAAQTAVFDVAAGGAPSLPVRFLFPTHCELEIVKIEVDDAARLQPGFTPYDARCAPGSPGLTWTVFGDSIVQGANVVCPSMTWVEQAARALKVRAINLGIGGYGGLEAAVARDLAGRPDMDMLSLHGGVNCIGMTAAEFEPRVEEFLSILRHAHPRLPVLLCTPIYSYRDAANPQGARAIRTVLTRACRRRQAAGDDRLLLLDGRRIFRDATHLRGDMLHLSEAGSVEYARRMLPYLRRLIALAARRA